MSVVLQRSQALELNVVEYRGAVSLADLTGFARSQAHNPQSLKSDCLNLVLPGAHFHDVDFTALDALFAHYLEIYGPLQFHIYRRSAWICQSEAAYAHVEHWLEGRNTRDGMSSDVRLFSGFAEAGDWLILNQAEIAMLENREGFVELERFDDAAGRARAASR